ncbi:19701_t:CDS:2, partial [Rhizophagus irregularis]
TPYKEPLQQKLRNGVADWIVTDRLPFNTVREKGCGYKITVELMKNYIEEICIYAFITTDLWTLRAKTGYIGITYHWLTQEMKLYDILVYVEKISYPHTRTHICETIQEKLKVLGLEKKVNVAVTDNGTNKTGLLPSVENNENVDENNQHEKNKPLKILEQLQSLETDYEARKNYQRLTALMLSDIEWKLLDNATQFLEGQKYCTLSLIFSSIQILKYDYTPDPNILVNSDGIYDALFEYWNISPNSTLLASLLDPKSKTIYGWFNELQKLAKLLLNTEYKEYKDNDIFIQIYLLFQSRSQSFSSRIFGPQIHLSTDNELTQYLDNFCTSQASPDTDIFKWWIDNREKFPTLFKVA